MFSFIKSLFNKKINTKNVVNINGNIPTLIINNKEYTAKTVKAKAWRNVVKAIESGVGQSN